MASNVRLPNGVDTDLVWPGRITSAISAVGIRAPDTQDFSQRYEKANGAGTSISANIRAPDGVDLSQKFTAIAANPKNFGPVNSNIETTGGNPALASVQFTNNGGITNNGGASDSWLSPPGPLGNQYQIMHTLGSTSGSGDNFVTYGTWINLDSGTFIQAQKANVGIFTVNGSSQIRRKSDGVVVCSGSWQLRAHRVS